MKMLFFFQTLFIFLYLLKHLPSSASSFIPSKQVSSNYSTLISQLAFSYTEMNKNISEVCNINQQINSLTLYQTSRDALEYQQNILEQKISKLQTEVQLLNIEISHLGSQACNTIISHKFPLTYEAKIKQLTIEIKKSTNQTCSLTIDYPCSLSYQTFSTTYKELTNLNDRHCGSIYIYKSN
jgi:hypothetical protein